MAENSGLKKIYSKVNAENAEDLIFRNHALFELGQLYMEKCDFPNAVDCFEKVKIEALQFHLYDNYFRSISLLMRIHAERLDFAKQESLLREVRQVGASLTAYGKYAAKLLYNEALAKIYQKDSAGAQVLITEALLKLNELRQNPVANVSKRELEDQIRDRFLCTYTQAALHKDEGRLEQSMEQAVSLLHEVEEYSHGASALEFVELHDILASILTLQGQILRKQGDFNQALERYWQAHSVVKAHRNWSIYYYVLLGLGLVYQSMGNNDRAQIFFDLIGDAVGSLELNRLKQTLETISRTHGTEEGPALRIDRERKLVVETKLGEIHFDRRFVLLEILYLLASQPGHIFSKEDLVDKIWRENYNPLIHDSKVYTSISRLRKLIEPDFKRPIYILNERDGYTFSPLVKVEELHPRMRSRGGEALRDGAVGLSGSAMRMDGGV
jgi:tetratricopeptide (TPR) repeat protein